MAAGPIFNAIADLDRIDQDGTLERIISVSGATAANVVAALKDNRPLLSLVEGNIRLQLTYQDAAGFEAAVATAATSWNGA